MNILDVELAVVEVPVAALRTVHEVALVGRDRAVVRYLYVVDPVHVRC